MNCIPPFVHRFAACTLVLMAVATTVAERPNVLIVLVDDMGYSDPGFMGGEVPTPHLDQLARNGLRFTQCYNSARCCPSRAALATGLYPHQAGIGSFTTARPDPRRGPAYLGHLNDQCVTFAEVLRSAGYQTMMVGKWHLGQPGPIQRGFDEFYGYVRGYEQDQWDPERYVRLPEGRKKELNDDRVGFYATDRFTDYALEFLRQARQDEKSRPWLMYLAHSSPHFPVQAPRETVDQFVDIYRQGWDRLREDRFARMKQSGLATGAWQLTDRSIVPVDRDDIANGFSGQPNPPWDELDADRQEDLARRGAIAAAMLHHVDLGIGRIVSDLATHGELDNTLIVFASDNGACYEWGPFGFDGPSRKGITKLHRDEQLASMGGPGTYHSYGSGWANLGNTPLRLYKHYCHEGGSCTPMVIHWPQGIAQADRWVRDPVHFIDIMPTLCQVAGTRYPTELGSRKDLQPCEGQSLVPCFEGRSLSARQLFAEHQQARSVREGKWKAVWSKRMPREIDWELYDLSRDRCETNNIADQHPDVTRRLSQAWMQWAKRVKVFPFFESNGNIEVPKPNPPTGQATDGQRTLNRPNFILVFIDDMGWADLGCFGNPEFVTPNIDRLAKEGIRFDQFYVNSPICSPSRVAISTGMYPQRYRISSYLSDRKSNRVRGMADWLDPAAPMIARQLKECGYATGHFGKWHMGGQRDVGEAPLITEYGFDISYTNFEGLGDRVLPLKDAFNGTPPQKHALGSDHLGRGSIDWERRDRVTDRFVNRAISFIEQAEKKQVPFYVNVWPDDVHSPFFPPKSQRGDGSKKMRYQGVLRNMDQQLGKLFDYVRSNESLRRNTMILVCSDNGPEPGAGTSGALRGYKTQLYEGGIRSPLVVWAPGQISEDLRGSRNRRSVVSSLDVAASVLNLAKATRESNNLDGEDLSRTLIGKSDSGRAAPLFFRRPPDRDRFYGSNDLPDLAVRAGKWKLLCEYDGSQPELYDLGMDPSESSNLALRETEVVNDLKAQLLRWHQSMPGDNGETYPQ